MSSFPTAISKYIRGPSSRAKRACNQCRDSHVRCDGSQPCAFCRQRNTPCSFRTEPLFTANEWNPESLMLPPLSPSQHTLRAAMSGFDWVDETDSVADLYKRVDVDADADANQNNLSSKLSLKLTAKLPSKMPSPTHHPHTTAGLPSSMPLPRPITDPTDAFYMSRYAEFIGPRFDLFDDGARYFSIEVPLMALHNRLLRLACLAAAAVQLSLETGRGKHNVLAYYDEALRLLSAHLDCPSYDPAVFASCLLIAHCEMVESKTGDWQLHLRGTGDLVALQKWHGRSGGLAEACFWIYCRMMILASLSSARPTLIPPTEWLPGGVFDDPQRWTLHAWQKKVVFLLGSVHHFWFRSRHGQTSAPLESTMRRAWSDLGDQLRRHELAAPPACTPISAVPATVDCPFDLVRYIAGPISAAWQMLHTAHLLHALAEPPGTGTGPDTDTNPRSRRALLASPRVANTALALARQVVSNSLANRSLVAWANAVQLLGVAGACLVSDAERDACTLVLEQMETLTGWNTRTTVQHLQRAWLAGGTDLGTLLYNVWANEGVGTEGT
ncbi:C6 zinc finger domain protein [Sporothrix schenckii 1099-18]|nr:C6 zinc finger domain protein [Sporothrix schenckii 1099-18]KJR85158.1 C6 zinc finger domain protein [Sporothrix schenckii 1099-18]